MASHFQIEVFFEYLFIFIHGFMHMRVCRHGCASRKTVCGRQFSFHYVNTRDRTQAVSLGDKHLHPQSRLVGLSSHPHFPPPFFFDIISMSNYYMPLTGVLFPWQPVVKVLCVLGVMGAGMTQCFARCYKNIVVGHSPGPDSRVILS